jgi:hypothetical protein
MTDLLRIELSGRHAAAWNLLFERLTQSVERALQALTDSESAGETQVDTTVLAALAEITKGWTKAKLERPSLDNEKVIADIIEAYERAKLIRSQREHQDLRNEQERLVLFENRLIMTLKWLRFLNHHMVKDDAGNCTLLLSNEDLRVLVLDVGAMAPADDG